MNPIQAFLGWLDSQTKEMQYTLAALSVPYYLPLSEHEIRPKTFDSYLRLFSTELEQKNTYKLRAKFLHIVSVIDFVLKDEVIEHELDDCFTKSSARFQETGLEVLENLLEVSKYEKARQEMGNLKQSWMRLKENELSVEKILDIH